MRSVTVVLPASMCAAIPMFRTRLSGTLFIIVSQLPSKVGECTVRFSLTVHIIFLFNCPTTLLKSIKELKSKALAHRLIRASSRRFNHPTHCKGTCTPNRNFHWNLVHATTHTTRANFDSRNHVIKGTVE